MIKKIYKQLLWIAFFASLCRDAQPIHETNAKVSAAAGGAIVGGLAGALAYYFCDHTLSRDAKTAIAIISGGVAGGISWYVLREMLYSMTPTGRVEASHALISETKHDPLVSRSFTNPEELFSLIVSRFHSNWPLIEARARYLVLSKNLETANMVLRHVMLEIRGARGYEDLVEQCNSLINSISEFAQIIELRISKITRHEKYNFQVNLFEKNQEADRKRKHEHAILAAQKAHESAERERERMARQRDIIAKQHHQQNMISQAGRQNIPTAFNIG